MSLLYVVYFALFSTNYSSIMEIDTATGQCCSLFTYRILYHNIYLNAINQQPICLPLPLALL